MPARALSLSLTHTVAQRFPVSKQFSNMERSRKAILSTNHEKADKNERLAFQLQATFPELIEKDTTETRATHTMKSCIQLIATRLACERTNGWMDSRSSTLSIAGSDQNEVTSRERVDKTPVTALCVCVLKWVSIRQTEIIGRKGKSKGKTHTTPIICL